MEPTTIPPKTPPIIGLVAPDFRLTSIQGELITMANYQQKKRVILWFLRGFTCMDGIVGRVLQNRRSGIISDLAQDPDASAEREAVLAQFGLQAALILPIRQEC